MKKKGILIVIILILGVLFFNKLYTYKEGFDENTKVNITPAQAESVGNDITSTINQKLASAGIPTVPPENTSQIFQELKDIMKKEVGHRRARASSVLSRGTPGGADKIISPAGNTIKPTLIDNSFFRGNKFSDSFCELYSGTSKLNDQCATLSEDSCNLTDCCVFVNGTKCMGGNAKGPNIRTDTEYYLYKYQCYGDCVVDIPAATSCHGMDCTIEDQRCLRGTPGAYDANWTCIKKRWVPD